MLIKPGNIPTGLNGGREKIDDIGIRVLLIPFFGISIPLFTQMIPADRLTNWELKFSYGYTIFIAFIIYEGTRFLHLTLRSYFDWLNKPAKKVAAIIITVPFYCVPVSMLLLVNWYYVFLDGAVDWAVVKLSTIIITGAVFFLVNVYETVFAVRDIAAARINREQLERARIEAELAALKNQIDPHFIFNSLNTLSHLIDEQPVKAKQFNDNLAEVYRYILQYKPRPLVLLKDEMEFLQHYYSLLKIRFEDAVQLIALPEISCYEQYLLPPISLQVLVENAIKHNEFTTRQPLHITVSLDDDVLSVTNNLRKKQLRKPSSRTGLLNLQERYMLTTNQALSITEEAGFFKVSLPLLKI